MALVDAELQQKKIEESDPQKVIKRAIDDGEKITEKQLDDSLGQACAAGLFTFSEIAFDKRHQHAVLAYSLACGGLCGHGNTLVIKRVGDNWKQAKNLPKLDFVNRALLDKANRKQAKRSRSSNCERLKTATATT